MLAQVQERAPRATIVVVTYPQVFPDRGTCKLASTYAVGDLAYNNRLAKALSDALVAAAQEAGVRWVDVYEASQGHDVCSATPWVNGPNAKDQSRANIMHPVPRGAGRRRAADRGQALLASGRMPRRRRELGILAGC